MIVFFASDSQQTLSNIQSVLCIFPSTRFTRPINSIILENSTHSKPKIYRNQPEIGLGNVDSILRYIGVNQPSGNQLQVIDLQKFGF